MLRHTSPQGHSSSSIVNRASYTFNLLVPYGVSSFWSDSGYCNETSIHTFVHAMWCPHSLFHRRIWREHNRKKGQTALIRCRSWPDKVFTYIQPFSSHFCSSQNHIKPFLVLSLISPPVWSRSALSCILRYTPSLGSYPYSPKGDLKSCFQWPVMMDFTPGHWAWWLCWNNYQWQETYRVVILWESVIWVPVCHCVLVLPWACTDGSLIVNSPCKRAGRASFWLPLLSLNLWTNLWLCRWASSHNLAVGI